MTMDNIKNVVDNFIKFLQLPESPYTLTKSDSSDEIEVQIAKDDILMSAITIKNGTISILYNGDYDEKKLYKETFQSPIYLLYVLSVIYYATISDNVNISFNDLLTIIIGEEISNWKDLAVDLAKMVMLNAEAQGEYVLLEGKKLEYNDYDGRITYGTLEFQIQPQAYTELIEAIFLIVEYVATVNDTQDSLFTEEASENLIEEELEDDMPPMGGSFGPSDFGDDFDSDIPEGAVTPDDLGDVGEDTMSDSEMDDLLEEPVMGEE